MNDPHQVDDDLPPLLGLLLGGDSGSSSAPISRCSVRRLARLSSALPAMNRHKAAKKAQRRVPAASPSLRRGRGDRDKTVQLRGVPGHQDRAGRDSSAYARDGARVPIDQAERPAEQVAGAGTVVFRRRGAL